jgi:SOS-response transcriptional repressor LexA
VELRPANAQMAALEVDAQDVEVKGVVAGLIRKY